MKNFTTTSILQYQYEGFLKIPSLWERNNPLDIPPFHLPNSPEVTTDFSKVIKPNTLLGKRAEVFFGSQVSSIPRYEILLQNIQIYADKVTIGELDFILNDTQENRLLHVELVCKIYLLDDQTEESWIGPNRKDGLLKKSKKLVEKQFPLLHHPFTTRNLSQLGIFTELIQQKLCFKAMLFVHQSIFHQELHLSINQNCIVGWWIHFDEFCEDKFQDFQFYIPEKKNWFVDPKVNTTWETFASIKTAISTHHLKKNAPMCWAKTKDNRYHKFFVVWW